MNSPSPVLAAPPTTRLASIDAYRGLVMFLMMAEVLRLSSVGKATGSVFWKFLGGQQTHVEWYGCSLHDLIQPSFSFLVGVALPFSIASRLARGQSTLHMTLHAFWRALLLICLGFFLRSTSASQTNFTFEDTLTQIGLGYGFLFLLGFMRTGFQWLVLALLLVGYWGIFALYPLPPADFAYHMVGVAPAWMKDPAQFYHGFAAHWNKNSNLAWAFDRWFLNLFPRPHYFAFNGGGYATTSFIPTLGTMILGLIAGNIIRSGRAAGEKLRWFTIAGVTGLAGGYLLHVTGVCPVVKRIWTPSWTLFSGGWCFLFLAAFYAVVDVSRYRRWSFPLIVIGMNSIAAYCIAHLFGGFIGDALKRHLPAGTFNILGLPYAPFLRGAAVLAVMWLILLWMYRRKLFLRI
jgi:heparan-alpha-glucosaminide N-acetyltransferase